MSDEFFKIWALLATAVALVLLGVIIGRHSDNRLPAVKSSTANSVINMSSTNASVSSEPGVSPTFVDRYSIPKNFAGLKTQWHSKRADKTLEGYAILFDPARREVIVEYCEHPGYFDAALGQPVINRGNFCQSVLWGTLTELTETAAKVTDRQGNRRELALRLSKNSAEPELAIDFLEHKLDLIYGSKNDLLQTIEGSEAIKTQKRQLFAFEQEDIKKRLQAQQKNEPGRGQNIPRYTLPQPTDEARAE